MKLENISNITFEQVLENYRKENGKKEDSWELRNLKRANDKFGNWIYAQIPINEIGEIVLPHYKFGGAPVIPQEGSTLIDAYTNFTNNRGFYEENNSQFCKRIDSQKELLINSEKVKIIYLSEEPLFLGSSYSGLTKFKGKITHLDGLHRLFALMDLDKKITNSLESNIAIY